MCSPQNKSFSFFVTLAVPVLSEVVKVEGEGLRVVQSGGLDPYGEKKLNAYHLHCVSIL